MNKRYEINLTEKELLLIQIAIIEKLNSIREKKEQNEIDKLKIYQYNTIFKDLKDQLDFDKMLEEVL